MNENNCRFIAADIVIVDALTENPNCILITRRNEPYKDMLALPGGILESNETIEQCAVREAKEEAGVDIELIQLISVESDPLRDPRHVVSISFLAKADLEKAKAGDDAKEVKIIRIKEALELTLAADHKKILKKALELIKQFS